MTTFTPGTVALAVGSAKILRLVATLQPSYGSTRSTELAECLNAVITHYESCHFATITDAFDDLFPEFVGA